MMKRVLIPFRHASKVQAYQKAVCAAGLEAVPVLTSDTVSLDGFGGLLLMGGTDVNPARYGKPTQPETEQSDDERDAIELELIDEAIRKDLPLFAICRGLQILNVYHGGTLIQHLSDLAQHDPEIEDKAAPAHEISIAPDTLLAQITGAERWKVNSRHHQAADTIGAGLRVSARADDGTIEGLERADKNFVVAVQWHPEDQVVGDPEQLKLFRRFAEACG
jgi:putative glutamine amidotransferase